MGLLNKLFGGKPKIDWEEIKRTKKLYPANSLTLFTFTNGNGDMGTGWVDMGYSDYQYKRFCPFNLRIMVDLTDSIAESNPDLDMGDIEDFFSMELQKLGVAHFVARVVTEQGLNLEFYLEESEPITSYLKRLSTDPSRLVSFTMNITHDPRWDTVRGLMRV